MSKVSVNDKYYHYRWGHSSSENLSVFVQDHTAKPEFEPKSALFKRLGSFTPPGYPQSCLFPEKMLGGYFDCIGFVRPESKEVVFLPRRNWHFFLAPGTEGEATLSATVALSLGAPSRVERASLELRAQRNSPLVSGLHASCMVAANTIGETT